MWELYRPFLNAKKRDNTKKKHKKSEKIKKYRKYIDKSEVQMYYIDIKKRDIEKNKKRKRRYRPPES